MSDEPCPKCGAELEYDEVDIGVGVQRGNYGCPECGWAPKRLDEIDEPSDEEIYQEEKFESEK
jgi:ribosomal protein S27AE